MWKPWYSIAKADRDAIGKAAHAAVWVFVSLFVTSFMGWLGDVIDWLSEEQYDFPDPAALPTAAASAILSVFVFIGSTIVSIATTHIKSDDKE